MTATLVGCLLENPSEAASWFERAAIAGDAEAAFELGKMLLSGRGVPRRDYVGAAVWLERAANEAKDPRTASSADLLFMLGLVYLRGGEVEQNEAMAMSLMKRAADLGHSGAERQMGLMEQSIRGLETENSMNGDGDKKVISESLLQRRELRRQRKTFPASEL